MLTTARFGYRPITSCVSRPSNYNVIRRFKSDMEGNIVCTSKNKIVTNSKKK